MYSAVILRKTIDAGGHFTLSQPEKTPKAIPLGFALEPHGGSAGELYEFCGDTYFVPAYYEEGHAHVNITGVKKVTGNPTDYFKDMTLTLVGKEALDRGLVRALIAAARQGHSTTLAQNKLIFG